MGEIDLLTLGPLTAKTRAQKELPTVFKKSEIIQYHVLQIFLACLQSSFLPAWGLSLPLWQGFPVAHMQGQTDNRQKSRREYAEQRAKGSRAHSPVTSLLSCDLMNEKLPPAPLHLSHQLSFLSSMLRFIQIIHSSPISQMERTRQKKGFSVPIKVRWHNTLSQGHLFRALPNVTNLCSDRAGTRRQSPNNRPYFWPSSLPTNWSALSTVHFKISYPIPRLLLSRCQYVK